VLYLEKMFYILIFAPPIAEMMFPISIIYNLIYRQYNRTIVKFFKITIVLQFYLKLGS
jgi:hypothetical protein